MMTSEERHLLYLTRIAKHFKMQNRVGWVHPDGDISTTEVWHHLQYFIDNEYACQSVYEFLKPHWDEFNEPRLDEFRASGRQWHEWVEVPMTVEGEIAAEAKSIAYGEGWGRIGTIGKDRLELECFEEHRHKLTKAARQFAELLDRELLVTVTTPYSSQEAASEPGSPPHGR